MQTQSAQVQKTFTASPQRVYEAWTHFDSLRAWWHPAGGYTLTESNTEVKTGCKIDYRFRSEEGADAQLTGTYRNVEPEALLDYDWTWETSDKDTSAASAQHIEIRFEAEGEGCKVSVSQTQDAELEKEAVQQSWDEAMENLQSYPTDSHGGA